MENYYFTFWIAKYGKNEFTKLINKVARNATIPKELKGKVDKDEYLFHYFWVVYCIVSLKHFGLNLKQISFMLELCLSTGTSKLFPPAEILEVQKDIIPDIVKYIEKDLSNRVGE